MNNLDLNNISEQYKIKANAIQKRIIVCAGTGCIANGSLKVVEELKKTIDAAGLNVVVDIDKHDCSNNKQNVHITGSGCQGFCAEGPLLNILQDNILYTKVKVTDVAEIVNTTLVQGKVIDRLLYENPATKEHNRGQNDIPFYKRQNRLVLGECGLIDPESISEYVSHGGYASAQKAYTEMSQEMICKTILESGLRGRGGGGFPTGKKWEFCRVEPSDKKYIICNGDEGDPGAFMDRSLMEGNPHRIIEGMMIAACAIGADEGLIYVRMEYPLAVKRMRIAIEQAEKMGVLGENVFGSNKCFSLRVMEGAGAFVCGEETALMSSIEGKRGMPTPKPPFPAKKGLWGKPTVINNVETLAAVPLILRYGPQWFNQHGTENSKGSKTFALTGHVANTGLIEVPFGTTLREIVYNIGGGVTNSKGEITHEGFKAVQMGGPSGGCLTIKDLDMPLDYDNLIKAGAMVGSGGMVVMNNESCMIQIAKFFMQFTQAESCGKCVPCREGTKQMLALLTDIEEGNATLETLETLESLGNVIKKASLCGLGKTAPAPVLSTIQNFREEYLAHIVEKRCPTNQCKALADIYIDADKCIGCTACAKKCPVEAISGERKKAHVINMDVCTRCGTCAQVCKFSAVVGF